MDSPKGWLVIGKPDIKDNLKKFEFTTAELEYLLKDANKSVLLGGYHKYDPKVRAGVIPTIQINLRENPTKTFQQFKSGLIKSISGMKSQFDEFELIGDPQEIEIAGVRSLAFKMKFVMTLAGGERKNLRSRTIAIPAANHFFQLNFTDEPEVEDCSAEFDALLKTVKIGK